jgi:raffinose/stachyose/melibiose transport system permease protein
MTVARRSSLSGAVPLIVLMAWTLLPFASLFTAALHKAGTYPSGISWPANPQWGNFIDAWNVANMGTIFKSSSLIVLGTVPVTVVIATMAGFALGQLRVIGGQAIFVLFVLGLTLPFPGIIVPLYYEVLKMGFLDTRWAIILPLIGLYMPFGVFWMRAHFVNMPHELTEAARIDGANTWQLFRRVHVPLSRPAVLSLVILTTVWTWNQFLLALVLVNNPNDRTMAGALGAFQGEYGTNIPLLSAGALVILAPMIVIYIVFQRQFITALLQGSLKG